MPLLTSTGLIRVLIVILCIFFSGISMRLLINETNPNLDITNSNFDVDNLNDYTLDYVAQKELLLNRNLAQKANDLLLERSGDCIECLHRAVFLSLWQSDKSFTDEAAQYLRESYELSPLGNLETMQWRVSLSQHYWETLPSDLKMKARYQIKGLEVSRPGREWLDRSSIDFSSSP